MDLETFASSLDAAGPPAGADAPLRALWTDARGDWDGAHALAQDAPGADGAWVHAYLHRKEGDLSNAAYWYRRAGQPVFEGTLDEEWKRIAGALLERPAK